MKKFSIYNSRNFINLLKNKSSFVRTRGFRLACVQAQRDVENKIEKNLEVILLYLTMKNQRL